MRVDLIRRAIAAGKHVLAQKPLAPDLASARAVVDEAERSGVTLAVNQNGRWAPPLADRDAADRAGRDRSRPTQSRTSSTGTSLRAPQSHFDEIEHLVLYDHCVHWIDISRCWLDGRTPESVRALEFRSPGQPAGTKQPWGAWIDIHYGDGADALIRSVGGSRTASPGFWVHGTEGTIRGSILLGPDFVEVEREGEEVEQFHSKAPGTSTALPVRSASW